MAEEGEGGEAVVVEEGEVVLRGRGRARWGGGGEHWLGVGNVGFSGERVVVPV